MPGPFRIFFPRVPPWQVFSRLAAELPAARRTPFQAARHHEQRARSGHDRDGSSGRMTVAHALHSHESLPDDVDAESMAATLSG